MSGLPPTPKLYYADTGQLYGTSSSTPNFTPIGGPSTPLDKKTIYIFPGNMGHHQNHTLFSSKSGGGLGGKAGNLSSQADPFPVLSLPTGTSGVKITPEQAKAAIADLWRAIGAGYSLILPVRNFKQSSIQPFDQALPNCADKEPAFWGQNNTTFDPAVAQLYIQGITALDNYLKNPAAGPVPPEFQAAFEEGKAAQSELNKTPPDLKQVPNFFLNPTQLAAKQKIIPPSAAPVALPEDVNPVAVTVNADVIDWLNMLNNAASVPPFFKTPGSFSTPTPTPDTKGAPNLQKYEITYTTSDSSKQTKIEVEINQKTNRSTFSLKDPCEATAQDYKAVALAAIQASVAAVKPPAEAAWPIHYEDFTVKDTQCFEGVKAAVQAYYVQCLTQGQPVKPTINIQSSDSAVNALLKTAIEEGKQAALEQIKTHTSAATLKTKTGNELPNTMDKLLSELGSHAQSDVLACQACSVLAKPTASALLSAAKPKSPTSTPNQDQPAQPHRRHSASK